MGKKQAASQLILSVSFRLFSLCSSCFVVVVVVAVVQSANSFFWITLYKTNFNQQVSSGRGFKGEKNRYFNSCSLCLDDYNLINRLLTASK